MAHLKSIVIEKVQYSRMLRQLLVATAPVDGTDVVQDGTYMNQRTENEIRVLGVVHSDVSTPGELLVVDGSECDLQLGDILVYLGP